jgi:rhamnogalacturonan endolyase
MMVSRVPKLRLWDVVSNATRPHPISKALLSVSLAGYLQSTALTIYLNGDMTIGAFNQNDIGE